MSIAVTINGDTVIHDEVVTLQAHVANVLASYTLEDLMKNPPTIEFVSRGEMPVVPVHEDEDEGEYEPHA